ncbi:MAG: UDP-4-amino-4,6-dideoxy-N-acetyl-beta-L-altrosamine transaminase [Terrimicrobiaceae bacterium]
MIPYGRQDINRADIDAVVEVLGSDFLTQGPAVPAFENTVARHCGVEYAVAVSSATGALHIACLALGVGPGDVVWTSPITFVASANCALYCGAEVDFVDIDPLTFNISTSALRTKLERAAAAGLPLPKVVIPVHLAGASCDMEEIAALGKEFGFSIIEDASHAIGGKFQGIPVGSCLHSDITVFSFHPVKIITTGEGGMALTRSPELHAKLARLRSHGITRDPSEFIGCSDFQSSGFSLHVSEAGPWYYEQIDLGFNYRITDIQAALGLSQMQRLDTFVGRRNVLAERYNAAFEGHPIGIQQVPASVYSARHLYIIRVDSRHHLRIFEALREQGIGVNLHYIPVYRQPHYRRLLPDFAPLPASEQYYQEAISLPLYSALTEEQQNEVIRKVIHSLPASQSRLSP